MDVLVASFGKVLSGTQNSQLSVLSESPSKVRRKQGDHV